MSRADPPPRPPDPSFAVLCNPLGGRARRHLSAVRAWAGKMAGSSYREATRPEEIANALGELGAEGWGTLFVIGGDGTIHAVLSALDAGWPHPLWPRLAVSPGGTTNQTAKDLGAGGSLERSLEALRRWKEAGAPEECEVRRSVLRMEREGGEVLSGLILGLGAASEGIRFFEERLKGRGLPEAYTSGLSIARVLLSLARGGESRAALSQRVECSLDGAPPTVHQALLGVLTTLDRLILGVHPFWGEGDGAVHATFVESGARGLWGSLPRLAVGRPGRRLLPRRGYSSHRAGTVELAFEGPFVVDGELFRQPEGGGRLTVSASPPVRWVVP